MANLNIIGNGFDLYHGLPSSYYYFACYVLSKDEELYDDLADMYGFRRGILHRFSQELERGIDDVGYWREFEKCLGVLSSQWVEDSLVDDLNLEYPDAVDLEVDRPNRVNDIKEILKEWILETVDTDENYTYISEMIGDKRSTFSNDDAYISFNYTHTLEKIYDIKNILHIHGSARNYESGEDLLVGHGNIKEIQRLAEEVKQLENDDYDQPSRNRKLEYIFEIEILEELKKPVSENINKLNRYIKKFSQPENICAYGFSFGNVDMPYIKHIRDTYPKSRWNFSYYQESEKKPIEEIAKSLELEKSQYDMFELKNERAPDIEKKIIDANNITVYKSMKELLHR